MPNDTTPPQTITSTNHGLMIQADGNVIGAIHSWAPSQSRTITELYCFGGANLAGYKVSQASASGEPFEKVPGNVSGMAIRVDRYDLFTTRMETVFGTDDLTMLSKQTEPFEVFEFLRQPDGATLNTTYEGCWFSSLGRTHSATDDRVIKVNAELQYTRRLNSGTS